MSIYAQYLPLQSYKVSDPVNAYSIPTFVKSISWEDTESYTPEFKPGYDGNAYFAFSPGNSSGNGSIRWLTLITDDLSFRFLSMETITPLETYLKRGQYTIIHNEEFWALSYNGRGMYCIFYNTGDAVFLPFPEGYYAQDCGRLCRGGGINIMLYCDAANGQSDYYDQYDAIIYPDGTVIKNGNYFTRSSSLYPGGASRGSQMLYEAPCLWTWGSRQSYENNIVHSSYGLPYTRYLGTIANLNTPIVKNASQTLKVTYTLTDA